MYCTINFKTKKALKAAILGGSRIGVFQPGPFGQSIPTDGKICLEGPHYPEPHKWYAEVVLKDGLIVKVS